MKERIQAVLLVLLVAATSPIWIPCLVIWAGAHSHDRYDIKEDEGLLR